MDLSYCTHSVNSSLDYESLNIIVNNSISAISLLSVRLVTFKIGILYIKRVLSTY